MGAIVATHRAKGGTRRRGKRKHPKQVKRQRRRRADANGCAKRAQRRAPDRGSGHGHSNGHTNGTAKAKRCAHCRKRRYWLRRSLCWQCYSDPLLRGKYFTAEYTWLARTRDPDKRDALDLLAGVDVPASKAAPCPGPLPGDGGSPERQAELRRRAQAKSELFPPVKRLPVGAVARLFGVSLE